ncbi:hypothetical protein ACFCZ1_28170 [Streptomyces sp. NPDC056224]|uniref:NucA/NucB deoxyribonuclease domain-containing protein n=1 Tax=Streptomyces sp. NPDC056224 TaxID=3345750 RepID=UPI0035DF464A
MRFTAVRAAVLGAVSAAVFVVGVLPAQADSAAASQGGAGKDVVYKVIPYVISDPELVRDPQKIVDELTRSGGSLDALGVSPATSDGPSKVSRPGRQALAEEPESFVTDSSRFPRGEIPADVYQYTDADECERHSDQATRDQGWIKNRYAYCQIHMLAMPAVECRVFPWPSCRTTGVFLSRNRMIGYGKNGGAEHVSSSRWADFRLNVDVIQATGPFARAGAEMTAEIECDGNYLDDNYPQTDANACFPGLHPKTEKSIKDWRKDGAAHLDLLSQASEPDQSMGEQTGTGVFHIEYSFDLPWYFQFLDTESPEGGMRFDSAYYLQSHKLGSVFDRAVPGMAYDAADPQVAGVARHLHEARTNPGATLPTQSGKHFAGATAGDPIHRLAQAKGTDQNTRYNDNRRIVRNFCRTKAMQDLRDSLPASGGPYDCDEYAFASTYEGAGRYLHDGAQYENHYSARWVNSDVNQEAGRRLGRWYDVDRILDHEQFYIPITNYSTGQ